MKAKKIKSKIIKKRLEKSCVICGKKIKVISYTNHNYRSGHYFGKVPLILKNEYARVMKLGMDIFMFGTLKMNVFKKDPKPYKYAEYWECPNCYWG